MTRGAIVGLLAAAFLSSCTEGPVILATLDANDDATEGGSDADTGIGAGPCMAQSDCPAGTTYCQWASCENHAGTCQPLLDADDAEMFVCGCDHVTYFNDYLRKEAQVGAISHPGACYPWEERPCHGAGGCGTTGLAPLFCDLRVRMSNCPANPMMVPGVCVQLPSSCPPSQSGADSWNLCGGGSGGTCLDSCAAIQTQKVYSRAPMCAP
jgi:hypothetical protein